jgi:hypothetical protein
MSLLPPLSASQRAALAVANVATVAILASASCTALRGPEPRAGECRFAVFNRTSAALDVRVVSGTEATRFLDGGPWDATASASIGGLNPGEVLTHAVACAEERVLVRGVPIVATGLVAGAVYAMAELVEGRRVSMALSWP